MGGKFTNVNGSSVNLIAQTNTSGVLVSTLNGGFTQGPAEQVKTIKYAASNKIYAGGVLSTSATYATTLNNIGYYDGGAWRNMGAGVSPGLSSGIVNTINIQNTNQVLVGGNFTTDSNSNNMKFITEYNNSYNTFNPIQDPEITPYGVNGVVYAVETDGTYIYVGGSFSKAGGRDASNVARYHISNKTWEPLFGQLYYNNPGTSYTKITNGEGTNGVVRALHWNSVNNVLYVGGDFTEVQGGQIQASYVAYWVTGTPGLWNSLQQSGGGGVTQEGTNGYVYSITGDTNGNVYVGGSFSNVASGSISANNVARWSYSGATWLALYEQNNSYNGVDGIVYSLWYGLSPYFSGGYGLILGGSFQNIPTSSGINQTANYVAVWIPQNQYWCSLYSDSINTSSSPQTTPGTDSYVYAVTCDLNNNNIYIGGQFNYVFDYNGGLYYPYIVRYSINNSGTYFFNGTWNSDVTSVSGYVYSLQYSYSNSYLYAGGSFSSAGGYSVNNTAYWNGSSWNPTPYLPSIGNGSGVNSQINSIKHDSANNIIVNGGSFSQAYEAKSTILSNYVAYFSVANNTWNPLSETIIPYGVKNINTPSGKVYVVLYDGISKVYVGGDFINAGGISANNIAVYDISNNIWYGLIDSDYNVNGTSAIVRSLCFYNSRLYVGGDFTSAGGKNVNYIAGWNYTTNTWNYLNGGGTNGPVYALATNNTSLFVGGNFTDAGGISNVNYVASYNGNWAALNYNGISGTNGPVYAITYGSALDYPIIIGGSFSSAGGGGITASNIVAWNNTNFTALSDFNGNQGTNGEVYALAVGGFGLSSSENKVVYVGGAFSNVASGNVSAQYIAAYYFVSGPTWNIVGYNGQCILNGVVRTLHYPGQNQSQGQQDTRLFIGGDFTNANILEYYYNDNSIVTPVNGIVLFQESSSFSSSTYNTLPYLSDSYSNLYSTGTNGVNFVSSDGVYSVYYILSTNSMVVGGNFNKCFTSSTSPQLVSHNVATMYLNNNWNNMSTTQIPALNGNEINAIVRVGNKIYVGGSLTTLIPNNQVLNNFAYWDNTTYLWNSIAGSTNTIGVNNTIYTMELYGGTSLLVGGAFTTANTSTLNKIGIFNTDSETWTQPSSGVNNVVRDIYYTSGTTAYICGDFTSSGDTTTPMYRVATIDLSTNQINPIANASNTHIGLNNSVYSTLFLSPRIYFGGNFTNTSPSSDIYSQRLAYYSTIPEPAGPISITTSAVSGFINTETGSTHTSITIPIRYKLIVIIYNASLNQWLVTYRSTGVTFS